MDSMRLSKLPRDAAEKRGFWALIINAALRYCKTDGLEFQTWLQEVLSAKSAGDLSNSGQFPTADRIIGSKLFKQARGTDFYLEFQAMNTNALRNVS